MERIADASRAVPRRERVLERQEAGRTVLVKQRFGGLRRGILRIAKVEPDLTVRLDDLGTQVWELIDGQRTVGQINRELSARYPDQADLPQRLGKFLGMLVSRGIVRLT